MIDRCTSLLRCLICFLLKKILIAVRTLTWLYHLFEIINLLKWFIIRISTTKSSDRHIWNLNLCFFTCLKKRIPDGYKSKFFYHDLRSLGPEFNRHFSCFLCLFLLLTQNHSCNGHKTSGATTKTKHTGKYNTNMLAKLFILGECLGTLSPRHSLIKLKNSS